MDLVMIVAQHDFRDEEFLEPHRLLERAGHHIEIASETAGKCTGVKGAHVEASLALDELRAGEFDAAVFIGGPGARLLFDDEHAQRFAREMLEADKLVGAICVAPVILARAGLLTGRAATVFGSEVLELTSRGATVRAQDVVVDGNLITASGPQAARAFGHALVSALREEERGSAYHVHPSAP